MRLTRWQWVGVVFGGLVILSALSAALGGGGTDSASPDMKVRDARPIGPPGGGFFAVIVTGRKNSDTLTAEARKLCGGRTHCTVMAWTDEDLAGRGMPLTDREADAMVFNYAVNRSSGLEQALWDCDVFARSSASECM